MLGASDANARRVVVDASLNPSLILFNLQLPTGSGCVGNVCQITLPYTVNFGSVSANQIFVYSSGLVSLGAALPASAFSSTLPSVPDFFASSSYNVIAAGYRPDDTGAPASLTGGLVGTSTIASIRQFAQNNIVFCSPAPAEPGKTVCPAGFDPNDQPDDITPFIDPFIAANDLGRFEGDINLKVGTSYVVFKRPTNGFVDIELFQDDQFGFDTDPLYVGMKGDLQLYPMTTAVGRTFTYRFALAEAAVPEPSTWLLLIAGFGMIGGALRRRNIRTSVSYA